MMSTSTSLHAKCWTKAAASGTTGTGSSLSGLQRLASMKKGTHVGLSKNYGFASPESQTNKAS